MKKLLTIMLILSLSFTLIGCQDKAQEISKEVENEELAEETYAKHEEDTEENITDEPVEGISEDELKDQNETESNESLDESNAEEEKNEADTKVEEKSSESVTEEPAAKEEKEEPPVVEEPKEEEEEEPDPEPTPPVSTEKGLTDSEVAQLKSVLAGAKYYTSSNGSQTLLGVGDKIIISGNNPNDSEDVAITIYTQLFAPDKVESSKTYIRNVLKVFFGGGYTTIDNHIAYDKYDLGHRASGNTNGCNWTFHNAGHIIVVKINR